MLQRNDPAPPKFLYEFKPKLISIIREGYHLSDFRADILAGLTVAIVALPLSMAIAIASGVGPERGLYTTVIGGFLVSMLGGSRFQIGGPAGAFIILVSACVMQIGLPGLILATFLSGLMLIALALLRAGTYVLFIPYPVTIGFSAGIAVIIFASQIKDLFGMTLTATEPGEMIAKIETLWSVRATVLPAAVGVTLGTLALILGIKRFAPTWPNLLIAVAGAAAVVAAFGLPVETIFSRFGTLPRTLPLPALPGLSLQAVWVALPWAFSFTLLGAIESLLAALVADGMSGRRHRPNAELLAQGVANMGAAIFGGFCVTGTIARTATNVRSGSRGPVSGMLHAVFVGLFMLIAAPLAGYIPLAALAAMLAVVAWNMIEKEAVWQLLRSSRADAVVLLATFLLVVFRDLPSGIVVGFALGGLVFIQRMSDTASFSRFDDDADNPSNPADCAVYHLHGPYFFGASARLSTLLDKVTEQPRAFVMDFSDVPFVDSTGARSFELLSHKVDRKGGKLFLTGTRPDVKQSLIHAGVTEPHVRYLPDVASVEEALRSAEA
ncbi:MAG: SulP family inorganic anion transporter [Paracoccaceae bacterium]